MNDSKSAVSPRTGVHAELTYPSLGAVTESKRNSLSLFLSRCASILRLWVWQSHSGKDGHIL
jgi:hypothetical protein